MFVLNKSQKYDLKVFGVIFLVLSLICIFLKLPIIDFDFLNYHNYIAYAFLNNRIDIDFMPANYHSYLNPYIDTVFYGLMKILNTHPYIFYSISALDNSVFLFMVYKLTKYVLKIQNKIKYVILTLLYIAFTPILTDSLDFSKNDIFVGSLVLISLI